MRGWIKITIWNTILSTIRPTTFPPVFGFLTFQYFGFFWSNKLLNYCLHMELGSTYSVLDVPYYPLQFDLHRTSADAGGLFCTTCSANTQKQLGFSGIVLRNGCFAVGFGSINQNSAGRCLGALFFWSFRWDNALSHASSYFSYYHTNSTVCSSQCLWPMQWP